jgi:hypothetical protein
VGNKSYNFNIDAVLVNVEKVTKFKIGAAKLQTTGVRNLKLNIFEYDGRGTH